MDISRGMCYNPLHAIFITAYPQIQLLYIDIPLPNLTPIGIVALIGMPTYRRGSDCEENVTFLVGV
jgi:hypothetical protein